MTFVLDASLTMTWCFPDDSSLATEAVLDRLRDEEAHVPPTWLLEVANVLLVAERRQRIAPTEAVRFIQTLHALPIRIDVVRSIVKIAPLLLLARDYSLSPYDAAYLELAMSSGFPLATGDAQLRTAARSAGVRVIT